MAVVEEVSDYFTPTIIAIESSVGIIFKIHKNAVRCVLLSLVY